MLRGLFFIRNMANMNIEEFRKIYADWQQSGQSVRAYTRFYYWQKRLKDWGAKETAHYVVAERCM